MNNIENQIQNWNKILSDSKADVYTSNQKRRQLFSQIQLTLLDVEEFYLENNNNNIEYDPLTKHTIEQLEKLSNQLPLKPIKDRQRFILDDISRFICK